MVIFVSGGLMDKSSKQISEILSILRKKQAEEAKDKKMEEKEKKMKMSMHKKMIDIED